MFDSVFTSDWLLTFDMKVYQFAENLFAGSKAFESVMIFFTHLGDDGILWIALSIVLLLFKKTRKIGIAMAGALVMASFVNNIIFKKLLFARLRPYYMPYENWQRVATDGWKYSFPYLGTKLEEHSYSFPSGHTTSSFAAAIGVFYIDKKKGIIPLIVAAIIGYSRIYIHVHYPSDVCAGAITGIVFGLLACVLIFRVCGGLLDKLNAKTGYRLLPVEGEEAQGETPDVGEEATEVAEEAENAEETSEETNETEETDEAEEADDADSAEETE